MRNIEYTKMAYLYDKFYSNKNYSKEVEFICNFIEKQNCKILDAGCGTGNHAKLLYDLGYEIQGFDLNKEMIDIANSKLKNHFFVDNILRFSYTSKYDLIISFFAVFNHLKNYKQVKTALLNLKKSLNAGGTIIIDLHNPQNNGKKIDIIDNNTTRIMKWHKCNLFEKEFSQITYYIDNKSFKTHHSFKIFNLAKLTKIAKEIGFKEINFYENYNTNQKPTIKSKNIQIVLK